MLTGCMVLLLPVYVCPHGPPSEWKRSAATSLAAQYQQPSIAALVTQTPHHNQIRLVSNNYGRLQATIEKL
ncbi:hypothetical protein BDP55DRAFT_226108 [Colletotrichum godetiae]|uniref:Secreted protein n=1 Tax=Colletotrichum godetiae TaxID=1209918 RepID=A0AAJ0ETN2_9PEZI|nr:uncharacterized protein BDP55DRAFT_226108 [Colletotrichum godetiae]KAK1673493.1 hypothetical protein BDP55DRAFT_226108 [Colletotrichum godetiae]